LAFTPAFIIAAHAIQDRRRDFHEETLILGGIIQLYYVRFGVFFGCLGTFVRLVRGDHSPPLKKGEGRSAAVALAQPLLRLPLQRREVAAVDAAEGLVHAAG